MSWPLICFLFASVTLVAFIVFRIIGKLYASNRTIPTIASFVIGGICSLILLVALFKGLISEDFKSDSILLKISIFLFLIPTAWFIFKIYYHYHRKTIYYTINDVKGGFDPDVALELDEYICGLGSEPYKFSIKYGISGKEKGDFFRLVYHMGSSPDPYLCVFVSSVLSAKAGNYNGNSLISMSTLCNNKAILPIGRYIELLEKAKNIFTDENQKNKEKIYADTVALILKIVSVIHQDNINVVTETDAIVSELKDNMLDQYWTKGGFEYEVDPFMECYIKCLQDDTDRIVSEFEQQYHKPFPS